MTESDTWTPERIHESTVTGVGDSVVLTGHRKDNKPTALLPPQQLTIKPPPESTWPGLSGGGGERRHSAEGMRKAVGEPIDADLEHLGEARKIIELLAPDFGPAAWVQGNNLQTATDMMKATMALYIARVEENLANVRAAVVAAAAQFDDAEHANVASARNVDSQIQGGGGGASAVFADSPMQSSSPVQTDYRPPHAEPQPHAPIQQEAQSGASHTQPKTKTSGS